MKSNSKTKTVAALIKDVERKKIDFDNPLQRKEGQWSRFMQSLLIDSLLREYIVLPAVAEVTDKGWSIIDGIQRITTPKSYVNNEFQLSRKLKPVVIDGVEYTIAGKKFEKLDEEVKDALQTAEMQTYELRDATPEDIREMFKRLNSGKPLNKAQMAAIYLNDEMGKAIREIMDHPLWIKTGLTAGDIKADNTRNIALQILMILSGYEYTGFDAANIERFCSYLNADTEVSLQLVGHTIDVLNLLDSKMEEKIQDMKKLSIPMVVAAMEHVMGDQEKEDTYIQWLYDFFNDFDNFKTTEQYEEAWSVRTDKLENVNHRLELFMQAVNNL